MKKYRTSLFFYLALVLNSSLVLAQNKKLDSLQACLKAAGSDTLKIKIYNSLSKSLDISGQPDSAISCANKALDLNKKTTGWKGASLAAIKSYSVLGDIFFDLGDIPRSRSYSLKALSIAKKEGLNKQMASSIKDIGDTYSIAGDHEKAISYYTNALTISMVEKDTNTIANCYNNIGTNYINQGEATKAIYNYKEAMKLREMIGDKAGMALSYLTLALTYNLRGMSKESMDFYFKSIKIAEELDNKIEVASAYTGIGKIFQGQKEYDKALEYELKALKIHTEIKNVSGVITDYISLGEITKEKNDTASAAGYYRKGLELCKAEGMERLKGQLLIDMGQIYRLEKNYKAAFACFSEAGAFFEKTNDEGGKAITYVALGGLYTDQKKYSEAENYYKKGLLIAKSNDLADVTMNYYLDLFKMYSGQGNYKQALENYQLYTDIKDSTLNRENTKKLTETELNYEFEKKEAEIKARQEKKDELSALEHKRKQLVAIAVIIVLILIIIIAFLFINRQKLKFRKDKIIFEQQEALLLSEKQKTEEELLNAKKLLDNYTDSLIQKSKLIEDFKEEIEKLTILKSEEIYSEKIEQLDSLNKLTILTAEDWDKFKELFEQVHKGFFIRLKDKFPELTNAEIRLICLTKLNIDSKQMANMLGVSPDTITKTRYRLKKKMELSENENLDKFMKSI